MTLRAGNRMNYHSHERRDEIWNIVSGNAVVVLDGVRKSVTAGDVVQLKAGVKHTIIAETDIQLLELQLGKNIKAEDKIRYELKD